jgi:hypothetical protein
VKLGLKTHVTASVDVAHVPSNPLAIKKDPVQPIVVMFCVVTAARPGRAVQEIPSIDETQLPSEPTTTIRELFVLTAIEFGVIVDDE